MADGRARPVLVDLHAGGAAEHLLDDRLGIGGVPLAEVPEVEREVGHGLEHPLEVPRAGALDADGLRTRSTADHCGDASRLVLVELLDGVEMRVDVDQPGCDDPALDREDVGVRADDQPGRDVHRVRIAGLADADDLPVEHADVALDDAQDRIDQDGVRHDHVERPVGALEARHLAHPVADRLAAAEDQLVTVGREIGLDLRDEARVGEVDPVAGGRPVLRGVVRAVDAKCSRVASPSRRAARRPAWSR